MTKQNPNARLKRSRSVCYFIFVPHALALPLCGVTMSKFLSFKSFLGTKSLYTHLSPGSTNGNQNEVMISVHGCDPLPRRRCFSRAPKLYSQPFPINKSMWKFLDDRNVRWSQYRCKNFTCLASNTSHKGFFKSANCFNLTDYEMLRWVRLAVDSYQTVDVLISDVLGIKPGETRIGLDFSVGTGTFTARMRESNVTIVSALSISAHPSVK